MSLVFSPGLESLSTMLSMVSATKRRKPTMLSGISRMMSAAEALGGMPGEAERALGEAERALGEATRTGESEGDPGGDNSESDVKDDLLESVRLSATFGWTFTRDDILYLRRCRLDSGHRGSFRISSLVRVSFLLGSRVSAAVLVWEGDEDESGGDGGEGGGGGGGSGGEGPTTPVLSSNRDCWMISLAISCARSVAMSAAISSAILCARSAAMSAAISSAICSSRLSLASDMLRRRRNLVARPSSKNGPGEGVRILAGAVRTASHLENERGPEGAEEIHLLSR